ncbi:unnamed protein product [Effrenium voratum]|nr:unnamed protein product [Effrenium voratum]
MPEVVCIPRPQDEIRRNINQAKVEAAPARCLRTVAEMRSTGVFVPEMVFGHLLTSDNYDDSASKVVGGRNGYGAKLANVFSTEFKVETCDGKNRFSQVFRNNMQEKPFTCITFKPDLAKFGMTKLDDDIVSLLTKRVYDIAGSTLEKCTVYLNGDKLDVKSFRDYCDLYLLTRQGVPQVYEKCSDRWEICVSLTESGFNQVSFVNSICTIRGGTHVTHVSDQVVEAILEKVKAQSKEKVKGGVDVKPHHVRNHIWVFIKCLIENPAFDSQTKETLTTKQSKFGSRCELSEKFLSEVASCGVVDLILMAAMAKSKVDLGKKLKANTGRVTRLTGIPKLEDANDAGGKSSQECTLILTEGDSAKALAVAGLSVIGRDKWGVFPLRGKVLNVRDATLKQMMANEEIQNLIKIIGLDLNREYDAELRGLRYGSIMIMADQDTDGSHIKGLLINLIHAWWPSLARLPGFVKEFFTPIVKATKGKSQICFYTLPEYEAWKKETEGGKGFKIKYYKGLGTSTSKEAKEYFSALDTHQIKYRYDGVEDDRAIDLAFNKKRADDRKSWINSYEDGNLIDHTQKEVTYKDFVDKELVLHAKANVTRSASWSPVTANGLRLDLIAICMRPGVKVCASPAAEQFGLRAATAVPLAQIENCVKRSELQQAATALHQNISQKGENAYYFAHSRHFEIPEDAKIISGPGLVTGGAPVLLQDGCAELIKEEEKVLWIKDYSWADAGSKVKVYIECDFLPPGATDQLASATFDPRSFVLDIACQPRRRLKVDKLMADINTEESKVRVEVAQLVGYVSEQAAYHHGEMSLSETIVGMAQDFVGSNNINLLMPQGQFGTRLQGGKDSASARYIYTRLAPITRCIFPQADDNILDYLNEDGLAVAEITELPVKRWTQDVPNQGCVAHSSIARKKKDGSKLLEDYQDNLEKAAVTGIWGCSALNLVRCSSTLTARSESMPQSRSLWVYAAQLALTLTFKESPLDIMQHFAEVRLVMYEKRKAYLLSRLTRECEVLSAKARFVKMVIEGKIVIRRRKIADLAQDLRKNGFKPLQELKGMWLKGFGYYLFWFAHRCRDAFPARAKRHFDQAASESVLCLWSFCSRQLDGTFLATPSWLMPPEPSVQPLSAAHAGPEAPRESAFQLICPESDVADRVKVRAAEVDFEAGGGAKLNSCRIEKPSCIQEFTAFSGIDLGIYSTAQQGPEEASEGEEEESDATKKAVRDFEYLVGMPISTLTAEKVAKLLQEYEQKAQELQELKRKKPSDLWLEDLQMLEEALDERDAAALQEEETEKAKIQKAKHKGRSLKRSASGPPEQAPKDEAKKAKARSRSVGRRGFKRGATGPPEA